VQNSILRKLGWLFFAFSALFICLFIAPNAKAQFNERESQFFESHPIEDPSFNEDPIDPFQESEKQRTPKYAPGEILVGFKEGVDPQTILQNINIDVKSSERIHSIKPAVTKFRKSRKLEKDSGGWYWFLGKKYQQAEEIPDEEIFQQAYKKMSPEEQSLYRSYKVILAEGASVEEAVVKLENDPDVESAQPNYIMGLHMAPDDTYYQTSGTWGQPYDDLWGLKVDKLNCEAAWDISQGEGVTVAVIDTGIDCNHEDIADNIWINGAELNGTSGVDDDGNGYVDDIRGWDFSGDSAYPPIPDNDPSDYYGHGTHCAGIIAAVGNNSKGIIGVAPKAKVMPIKIFPHALIDISAQAIKYAADNGARVLSCSWGPGVPTPICPVLENAIDYAYSLDCVSVFAAGNNNADVAYYSPANYSKTIAVAATDHNDVKSDFSNWGNMIDIAAPGGDSGYMSKTPSGQHYFVNILSLRAEDTDMYFGASNYTQGEFIVGDHYYRARGTSMACPHVSGVAALIISQETSRTPPEVKRILYVSADDKGEEGFDEYYGFGRVNAYKALNVDSLSYLLARIESPEPNRQCSHLITVTGTALAGNFSYYAIDVGEGDQPDTWTATGVELRGGGSAEVLDDILGTWDSSSFSGGEYTIRLRVFNSSAQSRERHVTIVVSDLLQAGWPQDMLRGNFMNLDSPVIADIDNDGDLEVITSTYEGLVYAWHHDGTVVDGWPVFVDSYAMTPSAGDLDDDGYMEIVVGVMGSSRYEKLFVFQHDGTPYPGDWPKGCGPGYGNEINYITQTPVLADIDDDEYLEILVGGEDYKLHAWHHDGTIVSGWPVDVEHNKKIITPAVGDIDGDGLPEIVAVERTKYGDENYGNIYAWNGDGSPVSGNWPVDIDGTLYPPVIGDIDGDGQLEVVVNSMGGLFAFEGNGTIIDGWPKFSGGESKCLGYGVPSLGDLDGDGAPEVILAARRTSGEPLQSKVWVFKGDGSTFGNWHYVFDPTIGGGVTHGAVVANADGDAEPEVLVAASVGGKKYLYIFEADGSVSPGYPKLLDIDYESIPAVGDLDGDGDLELAAFGRWDGNAPAPFYVYDLEGYCEDRKMGWPMFHHGPQHTGLYIPSEENNPPTASITSISPSPAYENDTVSFEGIATDPDEGDTIAGHKWISSIDGLLSKDVSFATNTLSAGTHTITFEAEDNHESWSEPATGTLEIKPIYELSLKDCDIVSGDVYVSMACRGKPLTRFRFMVDGQYKRHRPWRTQYFSNGEHTVFGRYYNGKEKKWYETYPITVIIQ